MTVTTGRDCVAFLERNFAALEIVEDWIRTPPNAPHDVSTFSRREAIYRARMTALAKTGKLTVAEGFKLLAWKRKVGLRPGFLDDSIRCTESALREPSLGEGSLGKGL